MKIPTPTIVTISQKKLIGKHLKMSLSSNKTGELWRTFMPRRGEIKSKVSNDLYSLQVYPAEYFQNFSPANEFVKWALIEVENFDFVPVDLETFVLDSGQYAVFQYNGPANDSRIFQYIFSDWLPKSGFTLDNRPHFEILGDKYKNDDQNSEELIWIPVYGINPK